MKPWIENPYQPGDKMFLLFDSVHIFKNLYNNLLLKREFKCPPFEDKELSANYQHVKELYQIEFARPVKYAHKLNDKVLHPRAIEKTNVDLAHRFFHESTVHALEYFAKELDHPEWQETAHLFSLILRFFNTVNVKNAKAALRKRDESRRYISETHRDLSIRIYH